MKSSTKLSQFKFGGLFFSLVALALFVSSAASAQAQTYYIGPSTGNWNNSSSWGPLGGPSTGVPADGADVYIGTAYTGQTSVTVTLDTGYTVANGLNSLTLGSDASIPDNYTDYPTTFIQNSASYNMYAQNETLTSVTGGAPELADTNYNQSAGSNTVIYTLDIASGTGGGGTYNLSGGTLSAGNEIVGDVGEGFYNQTGGTNTVTNDLTLANQAGSYASSYISSGTLIVGGTEYVGYNNTGYIASSIAPGATGQYFVQTTAAMTQSGDAYSSVGALDVGYGSSVGDSTYTLGYGGDSPTLLAGSEIIGDGGQGYFYQTSGTNSVKGDVIVGNQSGSGGTFSIFGGSTSIGGNLIVGNQSGSTGTFTTYGDFFGNIGSLSVDNITIGNNGNGTFIEEYSANISITGNLYLGGGTGSTAEFALSQGTFTAPIEYVGFGNNAANGDTADFNQGSPYSNSTNNPGLLDVGYGQGSAGTYELGNINYNYSNLSGGVEVIGDAGNGMFTQGSGTNTITAVTVPGSTITIGSGTFATGGLYLGNQSGSTAEYSLQGGLLTAATEYIGYGNSAINGDTADFNQNPYGDASQGLAATNNVGLLDVGYGTGSAGTYELSYSGTVYPGSSLNASAEVIGDGGNGTFTQTIGDNAITAVTGPGSTITIGSGTFATGGLYVANQPGSQGYYNLEGGTLTAAAEYIGYDNTLANGSPNNTDTYYSAGTVYNGPFMFNQDGSSTNTVGALELAVQSGSYGSYLLNNGTINATNEIIGVGGFGNFTQLGGVNNVTSDLTLGEGLPGNSAGSGVYELDGGALNVLQGTEYVGYNSSPGANIQQYGGTNTANVLDIGYGVSYVPGSFYPYAAGAYVLESGTLAAGTEIVGDAGGFGEFYLFGGTGVVTGNFTVANGVAGLGNESTGSVTLSSGTLTVEGNEYIGLNGGGDGGYAQVNQSGATHIVNGDLYLGDGSSTFAYPGGSFTYTSQGSYTLSGGTLTVGGTEYLGANGGTGKFNQSGGTNSAGSVVISAGSSYNFNGGGSLSVTAGNTITNNGSVNFTGGTPVINGNYVDNGTTQATGATITYNGNVTINGAFISDPSTHNINGDLTVATTGDLQGGAGDTFNISGNFNDSSTNPLTNLADVTLSFSTGSHTINWSSTGSIGELDASSDALLTLNLSTNLDITTLDLLGGVGQLSFEGNGKLFYNPADNPGLLGQSYDNGYLSPELQVAPEPSTYALLLGGLVGLVFLSRFRSRKIAVNVVKK